MQLKDINVNTNENTEFLNSLDNYDNNKKYDINFKTISNEPILETRDINKNNIIIEKNETASLKEKTNNKEIWKKLKELQNELHNNNISDKKSSCFWCTYDFDNPAIYIPKFKINKNYSVYGCFCSPQCATAYLMNENVDTSVKFERYQLLNYLYGKIYNYDKNIKPAPNPHYLLDKYYGNLSIEEYRNYLMKIIYL